MKKSSASRKSASKSTRSSSVSADHSLETVVAFETKMKPVKGPAPKTYTLVNERPDGREMIANARLERFANRTKVRRYWVEFTIPEFTCICPVTGFPDFACITIKYQPADWCVELKSLKLYINQFRDRGIFHEDVSNVILDDMVKLLNPWEMEIVGDFSMRGNIKTVVRANQSRKK